MLKINKISFLENNKIICYFNNNEIKLLNLSETLKDKYSEIILSNNDILKLAKIGILGEIYWENIGEIINSNGEIDKSNYDISPEFAYYNSTPFND